MLRQILKPFRDMDKLTEWSKKWLLTFNTSKIKTMHVGYGTQRTNYWQVRITLDKTAAEKDPRSFISPDLKASTHVTKSLLKPTTA